METNRLSQVSSVYITDHHGFQKEYQKIGSLNNRIWVDFSKIPTFMKDAIVAIEDKRFYTHNGIDFIRTSNAVLNKVLGKKHKGGGSTLSQQLVKNITGETELSIGRKVKEIARSIKLEEIYSKDDILEAYLNIVNFGSVIGVQAAARVYFDKDIIECSLAECASIACITQNPTSLNPITNPENNKNRRAIVLKEMKNQKKISEEQYKKAIEDSEKLVFKKNVNLKSSHSNDVSVIKNWYIETMCKDILNDLMEKYKIKKETAKNILYSGGLKIYAAMDVRAQKICENALLNLKLNNDMELGFMISDYSGRILALLGSSKPKINNFLFNRCLSKRQPGSIIKPISIYAPCIEEGICNYSSKIPDMPVLVDVNNDGNKKEWPLNWYNEYRGEVILAWALEKSANAPAVQLLYKLGMTKSFDFLTKRLKLSLDSSDKNSMAALATGGMKFGVSVKEMVSAFSIFGDEGKFKNQYTYSYVTDKENKIILDNRTNSNFIQAISPETAYIMNRLMRQVIVGTEGTGKGANINGIEVVGKTGTTNNDFDSWFIGLTPWCVAGIWTGYDTPKRIKDTSCAIRIWKDIMKEILSDKPSKEFKQNENIIQKEYCAESGRIANPFCPNKKIGYYDKNFIPSECDLH